MRGVGEGVIPEPHQVGGEEQRNHGLLHFLGNHSSTCQQIYDEGSTVCKKSEEKKPLNIDACS